jgi:hypothetical protein
MREIILMMRVSADGFLVIIGASAGRVPGADITCGQEPEALYQAQFAPTIAEAGGRTGKKAHRAAVLGGCPAAVTTVRAVPEWAMCCRARG